MEKEGNYYLTIIYYDFEEEDVIKRILSLGTEVIVLPNEKVKAMATKEDKIFFEEPCNIRLRSTELRSEVIRRFKEALSYYK